MLRRAEGRRWRAVACAFGALGVAFAVLLVAPVPVVAQARPSNDVTATQAVTLARRAVTDDQALAELRRVRSIDGRPVDLASATAGMGRNRPATLRGLAEALDRGSGPGTASRPVPPDRARRQARKVLDQPRYKEKELPRPFAGVLRWLGDRLDPILGPIGRFFGRVFGPVGRFFAILPGGVYLLWVLLAAAAAFVIRVLVTRRSRARVMADGSGRTLLVDLDANPAELDRRAEAAEADGDLDLAVRLRYEAGLIRLVRAGRVDLRADTTASRVAEEVGGENIESLTRTFERVVYGSDDATAADVAEARTRWLTLLGTKAQR